MEIGSLIFGVTALVGLGWMIGRKTRKKPGAHMVRRNRYRTGGTEPYDESIRDVENDGLEPAERRFRGSGRRSSFGTDGRGSDDFDVGGGGDGSIGGGGGS